MAKMKLVRDELNSCKEVQYFNWVTNGKVVGNIAIYEEGLVEVHQNKRKNLPPVEIALECLNTDDPEVVVQFAGSADGKFQTLHQEGVVSIKPIA